MNTQAFVQYNALSHLKQGTVFIDELPDNAGKVMRLLISGHKYVEIAVRMEIPIGTVKTRINISRSILRQILKDYLN
ncbi:MAG: hypothetical protein IIV04_00455 [Bacteroidaceae bacterium]|nr:hypothetical protein [Bacteroidaceae bacterium]